MEDLDAIAAMNALAQPTRLAVFRLLARAWPEGLTAGDIARQVGVPANTMSAHLMILARSGLIESTRAGRVLTSRIRTDTLNALTEFVSLDNLKN